jgi:hypothetical protein
MQFSLSVERMPIAHTARIMRGYGTGSSGARLHLTDSCLRSCKHYVRRSVQIWAGNFGRATRAGRNRKAEAMQFDDRSDHTQTQAQAFGVSSFV